VIAWQLPTAPSQAAKVAPLQTAINKACNEILLVGIQGRFREGIAEGARDGFIGARGEWAGVAGRRFGFVENHEDRGIP
jgi:hypothetical protein